MRPALSLTAIIPATNTPATLERCLAGVEAAADGPEQIVVVRYPEFSSPAAARNAGSADATGDILVFIDADVEIHDDVFTRIRRTFAEREDLTALFGSYDDTPSERDAVSGFRNLLHHHVHQVSGGRAVTFWAGLGAVRKGAFAAAGGFVEHPIEDIELGMRLAQDGALIELDPELQGKHLKAWTLWSMVRTDLLVRGIPWVELLLQHRSSAKTLNLGWRHRASALAALLVVVGGALQSAILASAAVAALLALNGSFYALLVRRRGLRQASLGFVLHLVHYLVAVLALAVGVGAYAAHRQRRERAPEAPASLAAPPA